MQQARVSSDFKTVFMIFTFQKRAFQLDWKGYCSGNPFSPTISRVI